MKSIKTTAAALALAATMVSANVQAQQKIGVVNVQAIFQSLPQAATIQQAISAEFKDDLEVVNRLEKDLQYYLEKQKRDTATMSQEEIKELEEKIISVRDEYAAKAQPLQQNIQRRQAEERNNMLSLIQQGINKVAEAENFDVVLNAGAVTYIDEQYDLSRKIIDELSKPSN